MAHCNDIECINVSLNTLVDADDAGQFTGITIGSDGLPLISYYDVTNGDLKAAHCPNMFCVPYFIRR